MKKNQNQQQQNTREKKRKNHLNLSLKYHYRINSGIAILRSKEIWTSSFLRSYKKRGHLDRI